MRYCFLLFFCLSCNSLIAQDLRNTEWIRIKAERKDGSRIIDHFNTDKKVVKYLFGDNKVAVSIKNQYSAEVSFEVKDNILKIGSAERYKIDTLTEVILALSELFEKELPDDKTNSYIFIKSKYLYDYLKENHRLKIIEDTLIQCTNEFSPSYQGELLAQFPKQFGYLTTWIDGSMIISPLGQLLQVRVDSSDDMSEKRYEKIINILNNTKDRWIAPAIPQSYRFKVDFKIKMDFSGSRRGFFIGLHKKDTTQKYYPSIEQQDSEAANRHFYKGNTLFEKDKIEMAIEEFNKCLERDSILLDAYYNLAACYVKLKNKTKACEAWKKLVDLGQVTAMKLHDEYCK